VIDHRSMVGPAPSLTHVPLGEVLPRDFVGVAGELRRVATELDSHPSAVGRSVWHWYPERREPPQSPGSHRSVLAARELTHEVAKHGAK
jgi:hypothetical protein